MKFPNRIFLFLLCAAMLAGMFGSCNIRKGNGEETTAVLSDDPSDRIPASALPEYRLIYPESMDHSQLKAGLNDLVEVIHRKFGVLLPVRDDFVREGTEYTETECEILLGTTNREESKSVCAGVQKVRDYEIRLCGKKLTTNH